MNLSDFLGNGWDDPRSSAILGLAQGLMTGGMPGAIEGLQRARQNDLRSQLARLQIRGAEREEADAAEARAADKRRAQAQADFLGGLNAGPQPTFTQDAGGAQAVAPGGMVAPSQAGAANPQAIYLRARQAGYSDADARAFATMQDIGRPKVARTVEGRDAQGRPVTYQVDEFGGRVGQGIEQWKAPVQVNQGNRQTFVDPVSGQSLSSLQIFQSPDSVASNAVAMRGQNMTDARARESLAVQREGQMRPQLVDGQWVRPPAALQPGGAVPALPSTQVKDANDALSLIQQAKAIIPKSTGSYLGATADQAARVFGVTTDGDAAAAQLKALEGALVSKMPKMSGPQSDKDVALYKQMAGEIGDPTIPPARKLAALQTIEQIQGRYSSGAGGTPENTGGASGSWGGAAPRAPMRGQIVQGYKFKGGDPSDRANWEKQ